MKHFSAQYIFTNTSLPLKRAIINAENDGTIVSIDENGVTSKESRSVEFFNGIITPGFVNCHTHLELSHLKGVIPGGKGLVDFLSYMRSSRDEASGEILSAARAADRDLFNEGVNLCVDICNTSLTFDLKKKSRIRYVSLLEVFGIDPAKAEKRIDEINKVSIAASNAGLTHYLVPHSAYSVSLPLLRLLKEKMSQNKVSSIHFMESEDERRFFSDPASPMLRSYSESGLLQSELQIPESHVSAVLNEVTHSGNLILVHNTFADRNTVRKINTRGNTFWCLCPGSNQYIENAVPPLETLLEEECEIVAGTDSLASNKNLSILSELKILQEHFPSINLESLIQWATINGARALDEDNNYGCIKPGMNPGLLVLENLDLVNFRLLPETTVRRLL
jgi:cytosine/adenosine deaminase-related metal-dependent hydrolase